MGLGSENGAHYANLSLSCMDATEGYRFFYFLFYSAGVVSEKFYLLEPILTLTSKYIVRQHNVWYNIWLELRRFVVE